MNSPKPLNKFLAGENLKVADLITRARYLGRLNQCLCNVLDAPLTEHCQVASYEEGTLVLVSDSSVWASRLRYYIPTLSQELKQNIPELQALNNIEIKVLPASFLADSKSPAERVMSSDTAQLLRSYAEDIDDSQLKAALLKLARHGKNPAS